MKEIVYTLEELEQAVATVKVCKDDPTRHQVIARLLKGDIDYSHEQGKVIGTRRALFCSRLSQEKLWPERA